MSSRYQFSPQDYESELRSILSEIGAAATLTDRDLQAILRRHPKDGRGFFSKSELIRGARFLRRRGHLGTDEAGLLERLRMKPVRTLSGVAPVTVLTRPYPCPGRCIFCPSDVRMPKSYLSDEPGAQRAAEHHFDPYRQTLSRLLSFHNTGHCVDKVELIVLGGTWSFYPRAYQLWFLKRCFDALNDFEGDGQRLPAESPVVDYRRWRSGVDGRQLESGSYNKRVSLQFRAERRASDLEASEAATWQELTAVQQRNETASVRCVGLVLETRPDHLSPQEVIELRKLGATKVQLGYQSLDDRVLALNRRGHTVEQTRQAMRWLRRAGFKIHAHWMPNLYGSTPSQDLEDFDRLFTDLDFRPDELKIYPCSLIASAELMAYYEAGQWRPYETAELVQLLSRCLERAPEYCRLTRVIRDIPGTDIVAGNKMTNLREVAAAALEERGGRCRDIRSREVRGRGFDSSALELASIDYATSTSEESFIQWRTVEDRLAAFLRLSLPKEEWLFDELEGAAMIREVHVYGTVVRLGSTAEGAAQHGGLGRSLIAEAARRARKAGYARLAVISAVGTRGYYRRLGFQDGAAYQWLRTDETKRLEDEKAIEG